MTLLAALRLDISSCFSPDTQPHLVSRNCSSILDKNCPPLPSCFTDQNVGRLGPCKRHAVFVVADDKSLDLIDEFLHTSETSPTNRFARDDGEEHLDEVH